MRPQHWKSLALAAALALAVVSTANIHAQDQPGDQNAQRSAQDHNAQPDDRSRDTARPDENAQRNDNGNDNQHPSEHAPAHDNAREQGGGDQVTQLRHAHPGAAARCHDGFFTRTTDRRRACSKHGGIDVWLLL